MEFFMPINTVVALIAVCFNNVLQFKKINHDII